ncbi:MAG: PepSY domain-containing protein [Alphaproteobacteria bacterium]|nr:PepSY domain-containing protein [Alphaproteobacteria bacterium]
MRSFLITSAACAAFVLAGAAAAQAKPLTGHQYLASAKVNLAQARATALHARPGKIVGQELEKEKGGSGLRYSFDVKSKGTTYEVGVDARTGKVLENDLDTPD